VNLPLNSECAKCCSSSFITAKHILKICFKPFYGPKRTNYPDWQKAYETLSEMVVPRSTK